MPATTLMDLPDDALYALCEAASTVHPPHWEFPYLKSHGEQFEPDDDTPMNMLGRRFCLGWVYLSHVCRRLRNICLDSPDAWAKVVMAFPSSDWDAQDVPLARARDAPLHLNITRFDHHNSEASYMKKILFAQSHIQRAVSVETTDGGQESSFDWRYTFMKKKYPKLKFLDISQHPPARFTIDAPDLRIFHGKDVLPLFPFSPTRLRVLELNLQAESGIGGGRRVEDRVLDILRASPLLEDLTLRLVVDRFSGEVQMAGPPIELKHLEWAVLGGSGAIDLGLIHSSLLIPERTSVLFTIIGPCYDEPALFHSVAPQMRSQDYAQLFVTFKEEFEFNALPHVMDIEGDTVSHQVKLTFQPKRGDIVGIEDKLEHILVATNPEQIQFLYFTAGRPFDATGSAPALFTFFNAFDAVTALTLHTDEDTTWPIFFVLTSHAASLFPSLRMFMVQHDPLHDMDPVYGGSPSHPLAGKTYWNAILGFLKARMQADRLIPRLYLAGTWPWQGSRGSKSWSAIDARSIELAKTYVDELVDTRTKGPRLRLCTSLSKFLSVVV